MKKFLLLIVVFIVTLTSCSIENDDSTNYYLEVLPIDSVVVPEQFVYGETYQIFITYTRPNTCYLFNDFIYEINGHERIVAIVNTVYPSTNCIETPESVTVSFDFSVHGTETYLFKFYQGQNDEGIDQYHLVEVPVVEGRYANEERD